MSINRIFEGLSKIDSGNQEQTPPKAVMPTFVPTSETTSTEKLFDQQNYGSYLRNQIEARWMLEAQPQQDNFEQKAKELIEKYTPKNVVLVGKFDSKGLGAELAGLVPKGAKLGAAVFSQLSAGDKADTARAMIDGMNDETLKRMAKTTNGKALLEQTSVLLDGKTTNMWDIGTFAKGDTERKTRIEMAFGKPQVEQKPEAQKVEAVGNNSGYKEITEDQLLKIAPTLKKNPAKLKKFTETLNQTMKKFGIDTPLKQAMFLATVAEESGEFKFMEELPSRHASSKSRYKGRGLIQLTDVIESKPTNYRAAGEYLDLGDLFVKNPELVATDQYASLTAGWFWSVKKSGQYADKPNSRIGNEPRADLMDFREAAGLVNGGQRDRLINHWGMRLDYYQRALKSLDIPISGEMQKNLDEQIKKYQGKNHMRHPEQSWWDSPAGKRDPLRKRYGIK